MGLQPRRSGCRHLLLAAIGILTANIAPAQVTEFADIALDGGTGGTPFIRFDHSSSSSQFIVGFSSNLAFYNGEAYAMRIYRTASPGTLNVDGTGVGVGVLPTTTFHVGGDALIEGNLEISSSRELKSDIEGIGGSEAIAALRELTPVSFRYKSSPEATSLGFIAEDVPDLVATAERKTLRTMDIVAVLTRALQEQQQQIDELTGQLLELQALVEAP
ncbi:MAG: tail fiber domain-containing protein [Pseudomonadota bacterium]